MKKILIAFGTRPEVIKLAPVLHALKGSCRLDIIHTGQHRELTTPLFDLFEISPSKDLEVMQPGQDLFDLTSNLLPQLKHILEASAPDHVMVQGDTATAYLTALAAYYLKIPVLHVEAGLRTHHFYNPFPEEMYRKQISQLASVHFAPNELNKTNLMKEGISPSSIFITGNTIVDALYDIKESAGYNNSKPDILDHLTHTDQLLVLTVHRRENLGLPLKEVFKAVVELLKVHKQLKVVFPMHPNPKIKALMDSIAISNDRFFNTQPLSYLHFLHLLERADLIMTDSGGIQEEAASLGKPVVVLRNETERPELIKSGLGILAVHKSSDIVHKADELLSNKSTYSPSNVFGERGAAKKIAGIIIDQL